MNEEAMTCVGSQRHREKKKKKKSVLTRGGKGMTSE
jgi:hypothetical protein